MSLIVRHRERSDATQTEPARRLGCLVAKLLARTNNVYSALELADAATSNRSQSMTMIAFDKTSKNPFQLSGLML